jgi:hypothetical protein
MRHAIPRNTLAACWFKDMRAIVASAAPDAIRASRQVPTFIGTGPQNVTIRTALTPQRDTDRAFLRF